MSEDGKCFSLAVFSDEPVMVDLGLLIAAQEKTGRFRESPFEVGIADFAVFGSGFLSAGFPGAFDQAAIGDKVLDPLKPGNVMDFIQNDQAQDFSDAGNAPKQMEASGVVPFGLANDMGFQIGKKAVIEFGKLKIDLHAFLDGGIREVIGESLPMGRNRQLLFKVGKIVLAFGVIDMCQKFGPFMDQVVSPSEKVPGGAHAFRIDIGRRKGATPEQNGDLFGIDFVVFGLSTVDGFHI